MKALKMKPFSRLLCALLVLLITLVTVSAPAEAAVPKLTAKITRSNVLKLAKKYDPDGYFLMKNGDKVGSNGFMDYFQQDLIIQSMDTAVHEMCHANTYTGGFGKEMIYKGNKKFIPVTLSDYIYNTKQMASSVPKRCRTFRFKTYVSKPAPYLTSNIYGCYGLLNEFTAYNWGLHNTVSLFKYYKSKAKSNYNYWQIFVNLGGNDRLAYAEFRYYILHYLAYAKKYHKSAYKNIMKDKQFKKAFKTIDKKFRANIKAFDRDLLELKKILENGGHSVMISGDFFYCDGYGTGMFTKDYNKLMKEMKTGKFKGVSYESIYKKLMK